MASLALTLWLRRAKMNLAGEAPIMLRLTVAGKRAEYSTGVRVEPSQWDMRQHCLAGEGQAVADTNTLLRNLQAKARLVKDTLETAGQPVTAAAVATALREGVQAATVHVELGPLFPPKPLTTTLTVGDAPPLPNRRTNTVAFQHNHLIRTPLRMGVLESRIFVEALRGINHGPSGDTVLLPIDIPLTAILGTDDSAAAYTAVRQACKDLYAKDINLLQVGAKKESYHRTRLVSDIELIAGSGRIRGNFAPLMQPYLLQLTSAGNFTSADIATLLTLSPTAQRLYWILKSYANMGEGRAVKRAESLDNLKLLLLQDASLYPIYAEFVRRVLEPIKQEFHAPGVGFRIEWAPIKTGKKVTGILFTIPKQQRQVAVGTVATVAEVPRTGRPDKFTIWLTSQSEQIQAAYRGLTSGTGAGGNHLPPAVAQRIVRHVAGKPELEALLFATRHRIATTQDVVKDKAAYSYKQLTTALGREYR
jgi:plasmid replication initiation protein